MTAKTLCHTEVILASASAIRRQLLEGAGLRVRAIRADIDEDAVKQTLRGDDVDAGPGDVASILAQTKAVAVSQNHPGSLVIGADQVLVHDSAVLDKPRSVEDARSQLLELRGREHSLISAVACARAGEVVWTHDGEARLAMRQFTPEFLGTYLAALGEEVTESVGGYKLEGLGIQLFDRVEGDYFTILGLPMLALIGFLRSEAVLSV
ncbi:Maf family protein [Kaustia mangrovi]|uniref:Nucleoside triphosphate pyrophosphatase n=1 Tax=Kaustia mangrovi TaxID=2593653 RepID=A0A7S8C4U8_9HYPH|nr:Maf family protein [Kaustia mangrovi]QPC43357.1 Maf family protein [Kaustia mangrovi]